MTFCKLGILTVFFFLAAVVAQPTDPWIVHPDRVGPLEIGMTLAQLNAALRSKFTLPKAKDDQDCFYVDPRSHPSISLMIEEGRLTRVDVTGPGVRTARGVQVGDSEKLILKAYGSRVRVEPSFYTTPEGHYLTVRSLSGRYGIRFETEHGKVTIFYAGTFKAIQYVEGCE